MSACSDCAATADLPIGGSAELCLSQATPAKSDFDRGSLYTLALGTFAVGTEGFMIAAILPCFWIYWDVAGAITRSTTSGNMYRAWINTYAAPGFGEAVQRVIDIADHAAEPATPEMRTAMLAAFHRCTQYEYLFWDGAYHRRAWPDFA